MPYPKIEYFDPGSKPPDGQPVLKRHPLNAKYIPEPVPGSAEWGSFKIGLSAVGPRNIPPLYITADGLIIDGKLRWLAARELQWDRVPCVIRDESEAALIMMDSLLGQRNLERGAKAYIAILMVKEYIRSAEQRRLANLRHGTKTIETPLFSPNRSDCGSGADLSNPELADRIGCNLRTVETAADIYRLFYDPKCEGWKHFYVNFPSLCPKLEVLREYQARYRAEMEAEIKAGTRTIWQVRQSIAGSLPEMQERKGGAGEQLDLALWSTTFDSISQAVPTWEKLGEDGQETVLKHWRRTIKKMPESLRTGLKEVLEETL